MAGCLDVGLALSDPWLVTGMGWGDNVGVMHGDEFLKVTSGVDDIEADEVGIVDQVVGVDGRAHGGEGNHWHPAAHDELVPGLGDELIVGNPAAVEGKTKWFDGQFPQFASVGSVGIREDFEGGGMVRALQESSEELGRPRLW